MMQGSVAVLVALSLPVLVAGAAASFRVCRLQRAVAVDLAETARRVADCPRIRTRGDHQRLSEEVIEHARTSATLLAWLTLEDELVWLGERPRLRVGALLVPDVPALCDLEREMSGDLRGSSRRPDLWELPPLALAVASGWIAVREQALLGLPLAALLVAAAVAAWTWRRHTADGVARARQVLMDAMVAVYPRVRVVELKSRRLRSDGVVLLDLGHGREGARPIGDATWDARSRGPR